MTTEDFQEGCLFLFSIYVLYRLTDTLLQN